MGDDKNMDIITTTETILSGTILDHIDIDKYALNNDGDAVYEQKTCLSLEDMLRKHNNNKSDQIPDYFDQPYFLPFYEELPRIIYKKVDNELNEMVDNVHTENDKEEK